MKKHLQEMMCRLSVVIETRVDRIKRTISDERGASTVEYALVIAVIVFGVVLAASLIFDPLKTFFLDMVKKIADLAK